MLFSFKDSLVYKMKIMCIHNHTGENIMQFFFVYLYRVPLKNTKPFFNHPVCRYVLNEKFKNKKTLYYCQR